ncbi:MAG TPA: trehalose-phosphatase [Thermoanaerobaculia bacterium]|nr:trehalose-phosphatase [Thermoanaerobaculia bacterium]
MRVLRPGFDMASFFDTVRSAPERALLLDYDGTLAPFQRDRDRAFPYAGIRERLEAIVRDGRSRVAVVSGRPLSVLPALLGADPSPELWGSHGMERRTRDGRMRGAAPSARLAELIGEVARWADEHGWAEGFERKPFGFAFHGRGADPQGFRDLRSQALEKWREAGEGEGLELLDFDGGFELRPAGARANKGEVVRVVLGEMPEGSAAAYLGDDRTDEDAFRELSGSDRSAAVLVRAELRPTAADVWIVPPAELLAFLDRWREETRKLS